QAIGPRVAIVIGIAEDFAIFGDEPEVDAPGIDADAVKISVAGFHGFSESGFELFPLAEQIPMEGAIDAAVRIGETGLFFGCDVAGRAPAQNGTAAFGAEIKCEEIPVGHFVGTP